MSLSEPDRTITAAEFGRLFDSFQTSAFRLETRPQYVVDDERHFLDALSRGRLRESDLDARDWVTTVREATAAGKAFSKVHAFSGAITPYLGYEIEWAYPSNERAGDQVSILNHTDPKSLFGGLPFEDFWLFDDRVAVVVHYDDAGRFLGASRVMDEQRVSDFRRVKERALQLATPLAEFRQAHRHELAGRRPEAALDNL